MIDQKRRKKEGRRRKKSKKSQQTNHSNETSSKSKHYQQAGAGAGFSYLLVLSCRYPWRLGNLFLRAAWRIIRFLTSHFTRPRGVPKVPLWWRRLQEDNRNGNSTCELARDLRRHQAECFGSIPKKRRAEQKETTIPSAAKKRCLHLRLLCPSLLLAAQRLTWTRGEERRRNTDSRKVSCSIGRKRELRRRVVSACSGSYFFPNPFPAFATTKRPRSFPCLS